MLSSCTKQNHCLFQGRSRMTGQQPFRKPRPSSRPSNTRSGCRRTRTTTGRTHITCCHDLNRSSSSGCVQATTASTTTCTPSSGLVSQTSAHARQEARQQNICCKPALCTRPPGARPGRRRHRWRRRYTAPWRTCSALHRSSGRPACPFE